MFPHVKIESAFEKVLRHYRLAFKATGNKGLRVCKVNHYGVQIRIIYFHLAVPKTLSSFFEANECGMLCLIQGRGTSIGSTIGQLSSFD